MVLQIFLDTPKDAWQPGDEITGKVRLLIKRQEHIGSVKIDFCGLSQTYFWAQRQNANTPICESKLPLVSQARTLFQGPYTISAGDHSYPFSFQIPQKADVDSEVFAHRAADLFNDEAVQDLPPTLQSKSNEFRTKGSDCSVTYKLEAVVVFAEKSILQKSNTQSVSSVIIIRPHRQEPIFPRGASTKRSAFSYHEEVEGQGPSVLDKVLRRRSLLAPTRDFSLSLRFASRAIAGERLKLELSLQHGQLPETSINPPVTLRHVSAALLAATGVRAKSRDPAGSPIAGVWTEELTIANAKTNFVLPEIIDIGHAFSITLPSHLMPSLKWANIAREYSLRILITIECAKEKFRAAFTSNPFVVLPSHPDDQVEVGPPLHVEAIMDQVEGEEGEPPTFEEAVGELSSDMPAPGLRMLDALPAYGAE